MEGVCPHAFVTEIKPLCECSDVFEPVVVTVNGDVECMFFSSDVHLVAHIDESSSGLDVLTVCRWLGISYESEHLELDHAPPLNDLGLNHLVLQLVDDPGNALLKSEQGFDCPDASLDSESDFDLPEWSDDFA